MISYKKACKKAYDYFLGKYKISGITDALECDDVWIFYARTEDRIQIGGKAISVDKKFGVIKDIASVTTDNIRLKAKSERVALPKEYLKLLK